jgi:hypothetical protein
MKLESGVYRIKIHGNFSRKDKRIDEMKTNTFKYSILLFIGLIFFSSSSVRSQHIIDESKNSIEAYRVSWWNMPISFGLSGNWARPMYGVIIIDNGELALRHALIEGRPLGDYRLPYWPITSFVSIYSNSAELAHQSSVRFSVNGKKETLPFRCGDPKYRGSDDKLLNRMKRINDGFEFAQIQESDVLKVTNKGSEAPILMEHHFAVTKGSRDIPVFIKATNQSHQTIQGAVVEVSYAQDFNWSSFGVGSSQHYQRINAPASGAANSFFAFSSGMERGYEFFQIEGGELSYTLNPEFNAWEVTIKNSSTTLEPGDSIVFNYILRIIDKPIQQSSQTNTLSWKELDKLEFSILKPVEIKSAPVNPAQQITILDVIRNLNKPKVRGLHCIAGPYALDDLEKLIDWGGNLAFAGPHAGGNVDESRQIIKRGNELGLEMLVAGAGYYTTGLPPNFDHLFSANLKPLEYPDSYGQDEDHSYWYAARPTLDFEAEFGKPMSAATLEEKVSYWSRCFVDKWRTTSADVRAEDPDGNIWFYLPTPNLANIDPLDYHDLFLREVSKLGDVLTVFPFYYGDDYNQIEYMMRRWKNAGVHRAVFLPGAPTFSRPSQFIRAITAARRGGADGACGFAFSMSVYDQFGFLSFDHEWRWKSVMLASHANFPTPDLNAYSLLENPAELVEALSVSEVTVFSGESDTEEFCQKLEMFIPGQVQLNHGFPEKPPLSGHLFVIIGDDSNNGHSKWLDVLRIQDASTTSTNKGIIQMSDHIVRIDGSDMIGLQNAERLFLRFAEMAKVESLYK